MIVTIRLTGGSEARIEVDDDDAALNFLEKWQQRQAGIAALNLVNAMPFQPPASITRQTETDDVVRPPTVRSFADVDPSLLRKALSHVHGQPAAQILRIIAESANLTASDKEIRDKMPGGGEMNIAPHMAHITKCCKKVGIPLHALMLRQVRRLGVNKHVYYYRLSKAAAEIVKSIPDFDKPLELFGDL